MTGDGAGAARRVMPTHVRVRIAALVLFVVVLAVLAFVVDVPGVGQLRTRFAGTGVLGGLGFALVYAVLSLLPLPALVFTVAAGAVFGMARGVPSVIVGATLGAVVSFYLGRLLGRDAVQHLTGARLDTLNGFLTRRGFWAVLAARLTPVVPFLALNYLSGLTAVRTSHYLAGTVIGILPGTIAYVAVGAYGGEPTSAPFLIAVGALVALTLGAVLVNRARRRRAVPADGRPTG